MYVKMRLADLCPGDLTDMNVYYAMPTYYIVYIEHFMARYVMHGCWRYDFAIATFLSCIIYLSRIIIITNDSNENGRRAATANKTEKNRVFEIYIYIYIFVLSRICYPGDMPCLSLTVFLRILGTGAGKNRNQANVNGFKLFLLIINNK